ncbi:MAG: DUF2442 domain-containing protein, partial [Candidatus Latescibacterota bacterium]
GGDVRRVTRARALDRYRLDLTFDDGSQGTVDLSHLAGRGVLRLWDEPGAFESVRIGGGGELLWGDELDLCPDALYLRVTGKSPESAFPGLRRAATRA